MASSIERRSAVAKIASIVRFFGPDDPRLPGLRAEVRAAHIAEAIDEWGHGLSEAQRAALAARLLPAHRGGIR